MRANVPPAQPTTQDEPDTPGPDEPEPSAPEQAEPIRVALICQTDVTDSGVEGWLDQHVRRAIERCGVARAEINLVIVADGEMADLHEKYTGVAGTTDVLTFDLSENDSPAGPAHDVTAIEADLILCLDEAKRQAKARDHEPRHELLLYAIHGLMHLIGEDDHDEDAYQRMHAREDALLEKMGFGPLFDPDRDTNL